MKPSVLEAELFCRCGKCEENVLAALRAYASMCHGARSHFGIRRRKLVQMERREYHRQRYLAKKSA